jgi:ferric-dicitrate binding protein FerR (iron transport regulator)
MSTKSRIVIVLASVWVCLLMFSFAARPAGEQQLGRILYSQATSLRGLPVPTSETVFDGDALSTSDNGSALVELKSGAKLRIRENSSVRFLGVGDKVQAELLTGSVVSESAGKPTLVVTTSKFQFTPSQVGDCRFAVALSTQQETVAAALKGSLLVRTPDSHGSYVLPEGKYAAIPAASVGTPGQEKAGGEPNPTGQAGTVVNAAPDEVYVQPSNGAESSLKAGDGVNQGSTIRTLNTGRVQIALLDGSTLNLGPLSMMRIARQDVASQQTRVELNQGLMHAEMANLTRTGGNFKVQTKTATIGTAGGGVIVHASENLTQVYCTHGACSVQNIDPAVVGQVILHVAESTTVPGGLPPTVPVQTPLYELESQLDQTDGGPPPAVAAGPGGPAAPAKAPWHIGSLSPGSSVLLLVGVGGGVAAGAAVAASASGGHSGAASPSAP